MAARRTKDGKSTRGKTRARIRIGISGWRYPPWRGVFYPQELQQRRELEYASGIFASIEINGTFYSLQRPQSYQHWYEQTPADFVFAIKGSRFITHQLRLRDAEQALASFLASGLLRLREKLGPILWQLPPSFRYDSDRLREFFAMLPRDTEQALRLARRRDVAMMKGRTALAIDRERPLRHAIEVRHPSFENAEFAALARQYGIALVVADTAGRWPLIEEVTSDFMYLRLHGDKELYVSGYGRAALELWARRIRAWSEGGQPEDARRIDDKVLPRRARDVYCYFDNDAKVHAPYDAQMLAKLLGVEVDD